MSEDILNYMLTYMERMIHRLGTEVSSQEMSWVPMSGLSCEEGEGRDDVQSNQNLVSILPSPRLQMCTHHESRDLTDQDDCGCQHSHVTVTPPKAT